MNLIDFNDIMREAEARHASASAAACAHDGRPVPPFKPDDATVALVSAAVDEINLRFAALAGWEA